MKTALWFLSCAAIGYASSYLPLEIWPLFWLSYISLLCVYPVRERNK